jgi:Kef-type K+ transport system membrane component KefB/voltage-gated potassium channel Kch
LSHSSIARGGGAAAAAPSSRTGGTLVGAIASRFAGRHRHSAAADPTPASSPVGRTIVDRWDHDLRGARGGGGSRVAVAPPPAAAGEDSLTTQTQKTFREALSDLRRYMHGPKSDTLILLGATALITPLCKMAGTSPILGFLASGMLLGPNGFGVISGIHTTETLAELGIVFFLFEMGIELSVERLKSMKKDVFGLGLSQYGITAVAIGLVARYAGGLSGPASIVVGGALSLSSSAFVLQLIKDKKELATRFGKASFGVLLLQDLGEFLSSPFSLSPPCRARSVRGVLSFVPPRLISLRCGNVPFFSVLNNPPPLHPPHPFPRSVQPHQNKKTAVVPLLVATPILAGSGSMAGALGSAFVKAAMALSGIALTGRFALNPLFKTVAASNSQEAFLGVILLTALGMSFLTEGLGLSNTLGAFLAGVLISETKYKYQVEADIAPFRGILLGLFFVTVGFEIDVGLIARNLPTVTAIVAGILGLKAGILTVLCKAFGLSGSTAIRTGLILSQGGEFAFVAFGLARSLGILDKATTKMLLTCVSLTMALTPFLDQVGTKIAKKMEEGSDFTHYLGQDDDAREITDGPDSGFVVVVGYGVVGKVVCDLLDKKFVKYVGMEKDPKKAIQARNKGLPVFFGDIGRSEVAEAFKVGKAKAVIVTIADKAEATRAVIALRRMYPDKPIFARAKDADHAKRLQTTLDVAAMVPILPEDNLLLTLPFGGAVLRSLGFPSEEVNYILAEKRKELLSGKELERFEEESVLTQLGLEVPDDGDDDDESASSETKVEAHTEKEPEALKPLLKQVVEANMAPSAPKKKEVEVESEEASPSSGVSSIGSEGEIEIRAKELEAL